MLVELKVRDWDVMRVVWMVELSVDSSELSTDDVLVDWSVVVLVCWKEVELVAQKAVSLVDC